MGDVMEFDDPTKPEFASFSSYDNFVLSIHRNNRYVFDDKVRLFLETVVATIDARDTPIPQGSVLYRAQQGILWEQRYNDDGTLMFEDPWGYRAERMKPLKDRAKEGRANPVGIPVLYVGKTIETAVSEVRPWIGAELSVAELVVTKPLKAINLSLGHKAKVSFDNLNKMINSIPFTAEEKRAEVWNSIDRAFSTPATSSDNVADYAPTQILAELFKRQGYDALIYKSQFGEDDGYNIAVFDPDALEVKSCMPYRIKGIKVEFEQFGNRWRKSDT